MSFPTGNLLHRAEPQNWAYSDGQVLDTTTHKWQDESGNANHDSLAVSGSPTYKTNITPTGKAVVRFAGSDRVQGNWGGSNTQGSHTVAAVMIPRTLHRNVDQVVTQWGVGLGFNWNGTIYLHDPTGSGQIFQAAEGNGTEQRVSGTTTPAVGTAYLVVLICDNTGSKPLTLRVNRAQEATVNLGSGFAFGNSSSTHFVGGESHLVGENSLTGDVAAVFVYNAALSGSNLTDLESYLYLTYIYVPTAYTDTLLPASYTLTGQALQQGYGQTLSPASYALTGQPVTEVTGGGVLGGHGGAQWTPQPGGRR